METKKIKKKMSFKILQCLIYTTTTWWCLHAYDGIRRTIKQSIIEWVCSITNLYKDFFFKLNNKNVNCHSRKNYRSCYLKHIYI